MFLFYIVIEYLLPGRVAAIQLVFYHSETCFAKSEKKVIRLRNAQHRIKKVIMSLYACQWAAKMAFGYL